MGRLAFDADSQYPADRPTGGAKARGWAKRLGVTVVVAAVFGLALTPGSVLAQTPTAVDPATTAVDLCVDTDHDGRAEYCPISEAGQLLGRRPWNTAPPTISGIAEEGETLTSSDGSWGDPGPRTYVYQWRRCDPETTTCSDILGASAKTYAVTTADVGDTLDVRVQAGNAAGFSSFSAPSAPTAPIANATSDVVGDVVASTEEPGGNNVEACEPDLEDSDQSLCLAVSSAQGKVYYVGSGAQSRCRNHLGATRVTIVDVDRNERYGSNGKLSRKKGNFLRLCRGLYGRVQSFKPNAAERSAGTFREGSGIESLIGNTYSRRKVYAGCAARGETSPRVRCQYDY